MAGKLSGKVAIITGASAGIGRESAKALASEGANLVLTARREERLKELASDLSKLEATDVAGAVLMACTQSPGSRIIEIQMRTMAEPLA